MTKMQIEIKKEPMNGWFILRKNEGFAEYLHKDGTWHGHCGKDNFHKTRQDARDLVATLTEEEKQRPIGGDDELRLKYNRDLSSGWDYYGDYDLDLTASNEFTNETGPTQEEIDEYLSDILLDCEEERKAIQDEYTVDVSGGRSITITIQIN